MQQQVLSTNSNWSSFPNMNSSETRKRRDIQWFSCTTQLPMLLLAGHPSRRVHVALVHWESCSEISPDYDFLWQQFLPDPALCEASCLMKMFFLYYSSHSSIMLEDQHDGMKRKQQVWSSTVMLCKSIRDSSSSYWGAGSSRVLVVVRTAQHDLNNNCNKHSSNKKQQLTSRLKARGTPVQEH